MVPINAIYGMDSLTDDSDKSLGDSIRGFVKDKDGNTYFHNGNGYITFDENDPFYADRVKGKVSTRSETRPR